MLWSNSCRFSGWIILFTFKEWIIFSIDLIIIHADSICIIIKVVFFILLYDFWFNNTIWSLRNTLIVWSNVIIIYKIITLIFFLSAYCNIILYLFCLWRKPIKLFVYFHMVISAYCIWIIIIIVLCFYVFNHVFIVMGLFINVNKDR